MAHSASRRRGALARAEVGAAALARVHKAAGVTRRFARATKSPRPSMVILITYQSSQTIYWTYRSALSRMPLVDMPLLAATQADPTTAEESVPWRK